MTWNIPARTLIYDCEIIRAIKEHEDPAIECCAGWHDFENMGISVVCAYSYWDNRFRVLLEDNLEEEFSTLCVLAGHIVGFNSISFDDRLCNANGLKVKTTYDLLSETWQAAGLPATYTKNSGQSGYSLDALASYNLKESKPMNGALAPVEWQRGNRGAVIDYCLQDVAFTKRLLGMASRGQFWNPNNGAMLSLRPMDGIK